MINENKAIVTDIAGTTRDVIEEYIDIKGIPVKLSDTAGIRKTDDIVENIGVERSKELIKTADIILCVIDGSRPLSDDDREIFELVKDKKVIYVKNKCDLENQAETDLPFIEVSCKDGMGLEKLCDEIYENCETYGGDDTVINNVRHKNCLENALSHINDGINGFEAGFPYDIVSIDLESACMELGNITGLSVSQETVNHIFADFCVGK